MVACSEDATVLGTCRKGSGQAEGRVDRHSSGIAKKTGTGIVALITVVGAVWKPEEPWHVEPVMAPCDLMKSHTVASVGQSTISKVICVAEDRTRLRVHAAVWDGD